MLPLFAQPILIGQHYRVIQRLRDFAGGVVSLAMDEQRQERVTIKVPGTSPQWRTEYERLLLKEVGILSGLRHRNIITMLDWGQDSQLGPYLVTTYIEGGSVAELMATYPGNRLPPYEALRIAAETADALGYIHSRQYPIIHLNITPHSILRGHADGDIKLWDFALAEALTNGKLAMTQWGTPGYLTPEQALGKGADGRSDLYGLAATLYQMLTGLHPPAPGQPLPARPSAAMTPGGLEAAQARRIDFLILTLMAYDPNDRRPAPNRQPWQGEDVAEELRAIVERRAARVEPALVTSPTAAAAPPVVTPEVPAPPASSAQSARPKVFVSHSHKNDEFTARFVADLRNAGVEVWVDMVNMQHGDFMTRINEALNASEWLVLVLTPEAIASKPVQTEVHAAFSMVWSNQIKGIIPFMAYPCDPKSIPPMWNTFHRYDATKDYKTALVGLLRALGIE